VKLNHPALVDLLQRAYRLKKLLHLPTRVMQVLLKTKRRKLPFARLKLMNGTTAEKY